MANAAPRSFRPLTRAGVALASGGITLFGLGMATGNVELLTLSAFPLLLLAAGLAQGRPAMPHAVRALSTRAPRRGDPVDGTIRVDVPEGHDLLEVYSPLPATFRLEEGSNLLIRAGPGRLIGAFRATPQSRGHYDVGPMTAESIDATGLLGPLSFTLSPTEGMDVAPRLFRRSRFRGRLRTRGRIAASASEISRMGVRSTDFRELRDYAWGDPASAIHWKATARRLSAHRGRKEGVVPVVSEYEHEGKRTVVVLLDGGESLRVGTNQATGLDTAVEAALSLTGYFLDTGSRVGAATYGAGSGAIATPDAGEGQFTRLERALDPRDIDRSSTLARTIERMHGHLAGGGPFVVVFTRITPHTADELVIAARRLRGLLVERRRALPLLIIDVRALALAPTPSPAWETALRLVEAEDERAAQRVRATGARVVTWHPEREDFLQSFLLRGLT